MIKTVTMSSWTACMQVVGDNEILDYYTNSMLQYVVTYREEK